ncbi:dTDP-4-dehydrorhamnose reductase [Kordiimonas pumila]|uniref:dTDP-4-dehydrorhamnose reductase n=1 Tax=Kordiimonas pumila TaxID=2161677 RepID=A0ABV7D3G9_9PROT|nr:dTDP-4-dehydrorhamnose reductase [Kordiimonas pumila]
MRIFIAGGSGQVALSLQEAAKAKGLDYIAAGRPDFDLANLANLESYIADHKPTAIINAAAYTAVDAAEDDATTALAINADGAGKLARIAHKMQVPFVHISTDYVFGGLKKTPYTEKDPVRPTGVYGHSKLAGEIAVKAENTKAVILRTAWVYSPFGKNFLKTMLNLAKTKDTLGVVSDQLGNPTYAADIAAACLHVLDVLTSGEPDKKHAGVFHLAGTGSTSWHGFAAEIFKEAAKYGHPVPTLNPLTTAEYPTKAKRPANSRLNCDKFEKTYGFTMPSWQDSTAHCIKRLFEEGLLG